MNRRGFVGALFGSVAAVAINMRMAKGMPELEEVDAWAERATLSHPDMDEIVLEDVEFPNGYVMQLCRGHELHVGDYITVSDIGMCQITDIETTSSMAEWVYYKPVQCLTFTSEGDVITYRGHHRNA